MTNGMVGATGPEQTSKPAEDTHVVAGPQPGSPATAPAQSQQATPATAGQTTSAPATAAQPQEQQDSEAQLSPEEEKHLGELLDKRARIASGETGTVRLKVEEPHESVMHAGITVGPDWTEVPARMAPIITSAAADAGVTVTQDEES